MLPCFIFLFVIVVRSVVGQDCYCTTCCDGCPHVTIPTTATEIASFAFQDCTTIQTVVIPTSVTYVEQHAFYCKPPTCALLYEYVTALSYCIAVFYASAIRSLVLQTSLVVISDYAFSFCSITALIVPTSVTYLGKGAFKTSRSSIQSLDLPTSLIVISAYSFSYCRINTLIVPTSVTYLGEGAFSSFFNANVASVILPTSLGTISNSAFFYTALTSFTMPTSVSYIGEAAFYGVMISSLNLRTSVRVISDYAFYECTKLGVLSIPTSVVSIGQSAFKSTPLALVVIPTCTPSCLPSSAPTSSPTDFPAVSQSSTLVPTCSLSTAPSQPPTENPTYILSSTPSCAPSTTKVPSRASLSSEAPTASNGTVTYVPYSSGPPLPTVVPTSIPKSYPTLTPTFSTGTLQAFHVSQTIQGLTASEFSSNANSTEVLTAAIVSCFKAPISITASHVLDLMVVAATAGGRDQLLSTSSSSSILVSYDIFTSSKYPSSAYSTQLSIAVGSGAFTRSLQMHAALRGTTCLLNATSSMVSVGDRNPSLLPTVAVGPSSTGSQGDGFLSVGLLAGIAAGSLAVCILCGVALMRCQSVRRCCWSCCGWCSSGNRRSSSSRGNSSYIQFTSSYDSRIESSVFDDAII
eukprot:gene28269-37188_t